MDEQGKPRSIRELTEGLRRRGGMLFGHVSRRFDDPEYPHLAGFPVNISFPQLRWPEGLPEHEDDDKPHELFFLCLWPDPETFREDGSTKSLAYFNTWGGPEWVRVIYSKEDARWQVLQYRGRERTRFSQGPDFKGVLWHATFGGIDPGETIDRWTKGDSQDS